MIPLKEIRSVKGQGDANKMLAEGWHFVSVTMDGTYHLGLPADDDSDWTVPAAEFMAGLDPTEIDRVAMEGLPFDEPYGARRVLEHLLKVLGH